MASDYGFEPVFLPEGRELNGKASQTFLRHYNQCPRSAYLYAYYKGEASTPEMIRGSALHAAAERMTRAMIDADQPDIPWELVKAIAAETLLEYPVSIEEDDYLREMAYRLGKEWTIDPQAVIACETLFVWDVAGWQVRAKIDFAQLVDIGSLIQCHCTDFKSARAAVPYDEISRKRKDGTLAAKAFQLILYALVLAYGVPVREELHLGERVEVPEPFPLASTAQEFLLEYAYPGIKWGDDERMLRRGVTLHKRELEDYRQSIEAMLTRLSESEQTGKWPAIVSDAACGECPASALCPIPKELRDHRGEINTVRQASEALTVLERRRKEDSAIRREVKAFAKHHGVEIRFGADKVARFIVEESTEIVDRDGMWDAMQLAVTRGEPFQRSDWVREKTSVKFVDQKVSEDELAAERSENGGQ